MPNYPAPREIPPGKILIVGPENRAGWEEARKERTHVAWIAEAPANKRLRPATDDGKVTLSWSSPGFEIGGSVMRWTNGYWAVRWRDRSNAIQGRRFRPDDEGEVKARDLFKRWTEEPMILAHDTILAMVEGMRRVRRVPEKEWLAPLIERLERLHPGESLTIERLYPEKEKA